jgi:hypothetical protein
VQLQGRPRNIFLLADGDKIAEMAQFHSTV